MLLFVCHDDQSKVSLKLKMCSWTNLEHFEVTLSLCEGLCDTLHRFCSYLGFPLSAAWWSALNPLLLVIMMSAFLSRRRASMSSRFLEMASCRGVSPSESWKRKWSRRKRVVCYIIVEKTLKRGTVEEGGSPRRRKARVSAYCPSSNLVSYFILFFCLHQPGSFDLFPKSPLCHFLFVNVRLNGQKKRRGDRPAHMKLLLEVEKTAF